MKFFSELLNEVFDKLGGNNFATSNQKKRPRKVVKDKPRWTKVNKAAPKVK